MINVSVTCLHAVFEGEMLVKFSYVALFLSMLFLSPTSPSQIDRDPGYVPNVPILAPLSFLSFQHPSESWEREGANTMAFISFLRTTTSKGLCCCDEDRDA